MGDRHAGQQQLRSEGTAQGWEQEALVLGQELISHGSEQVSSLKFNCKRKGLVKMAVKVFFYTPTNCVRDQLLLVLTT